MNRRTPLADILDLIEHLDDMLINEHCACLKLGGHPCPRCVVSINQSTELVARMKRKYYIIP
jgi:hypothetical protein